MEATSSRGGYVASAQQMYDLSLEWYENRPSEEWQPPSAEEAEALFAKHGLTGEFWRLSE